MEKQNNLFGVENEGKWAPPPRFVIEFYIKLTPCGAVVSTRGRYSGQPSTLAHNQNVGAQGPDGPNLVVLALVSCCLGMAMATL